MLLEGKVAVVYGGGGAIGGAAARAFAAEGANVHLAGRTQRSLEAVAEEIRAAGGSAETAHVDALDEQSVDAHADAVAAQDGGIDISMNVIAHPYTHGTPMAEMSPDDYLRPIEVAVRTSFLTWRAAARHMVQRSGGVILAFGGSGDPLDDYYLGGTQVAFEAIESMRRQLAAELGPRGVRANTIAPGVVETPLTAPIKAQPEWYAAYADKSILRRWAQPSEMVGAVVYLASDASSYVTGTTLFVDGGWTAADGRFAPPT
jgi:3-oxoacyl-[acyl-carrier protein] reductase